MPTRKGFWHHLRKAVVKALVSTPVFAHQAEKGAVAAHLASRLQTLRPVRSPPRKLGEVCARSRGRGQLDFGAG